VAAKYASPTDASPMEGMKLRASTLAIAASPNSYSLSVTLAMRKALTGSPPAWPNGVTLLANVAAAYTSTLLVIRVGVPSTPSTTRRESPQAVSQTAAAAGRNTTTEGSARETVATMASTPTIHRRTARTTRAARNPAAVVRMLLPSIPRDRR